MERVIVTACPGSSETLWLVSLSPPSLTAVTEYVPGATDTCTLSFCLELSCREREITHTLTTVPFTPRSRQKGSYICMCIVNARNVDYTEVYYHIQVWKGSGHFESQDCVQDDTDQKDL